MKPVIFAIAALTLAGCVSGPNSGEFRTLSLTEGAPLGMLSPGGPHPFYVACEGPAHNVSSQVTGSTVEWTFQCR